MRREHAPPAAGVAAMRSTWLAGAVLRVRVRFARPRLDAALARGSDPWGSALLFARAAQVASTSHRQMVAAALEALVELAERRRPASPYLKLRTTAVLRQREHLVAFAQRLRDPAPVDVAVVARLSLLAWDELSPTFVGGRPVETLGETLELCASALVD